MNDRLKVLLTICFLISLVWMVCWLDSKHESKFKITQDSNGFQVHYTAKFFSIEYWETVQNCDIWAATEYCYDRNFETAEEARDYIVKLKEFWAQKKQPTETIWQEE